MYTDRDAGLGPSALSAAWWVSTWDASPQKHQVVSDALVRVMLSRWVSTRARVMLLGADVPARVMLSGSDAPARVMLSGFDAAAHVMLWPPPPPAAPPVVRV